MSKTRTPKPMEAPEFAPKKGLRTRPFVLLTVKGRCVVSLSNNPDKSLVWRIDFDSGETYRAAVDQPKGILTRERVCELIQALTRSDAW